MKDTDSSPLNDGSCAVTLARALREVRAATGMSLKELERITATSDSSLSRYLCGSGVPPWSVIETLCRSARRNPEDLRPLWQAVQRERVEHRSAASKDHETAPRQVNGAPKADRHQVDRSIRPHRPYRFALILGAGAVASALTIATAIRMISEGHPK